jgi:hypothetical protein
VPYEQVFDASFEDMPRRVPDINKIGRFIGYRPTVQLDQIIEHVVEFWGTQANRTSAEVGQAPNRNVNESELMAASAI